MRKTVIAMLLTLGLGGAGAAAILVTTAAAQAPGAPVLLAQATTPNPAMGRPARRGINRAAPTPAQRTARRSEMCQDMYARAAGRFAYLEARLNLTATQTAAFARWRDVRLAAARQRASDCAARPQPQGRGARGTTRAAPPSPVERLTRQETMLQRRLSEIQAERPALEALYNGLSTTQRQVLARGRGGFGMGRGGMGGRGMMTRRGPMRGGPRGSGGTQGPGMAPPAQ